MAKAMNTSKGPPLDPMAAWTVKQRATLEATLSEAATASLRVAADERPAFIALTLLGRDTSSAPQLDRRPAHFESEVAGLALILRAAVNAAARRPYEPPLEAIAAALIQGDSVDMDDDEVFEERSCATAAAPGAAVPAGEPQGAPSPTVASAIALALAGRGKDPTKQPASPMRRVTSASSGDKPRAVPAPVRQRSRSKKVRAPVLGTQASSVFPAVIGVLQEHQSKKAMRELDNAVVEAVLAKPARPFDVNLPEDEEDATDAALRTLGLS
jgi:hypothetical protein